MVLKSKITGYGLVEVREMSGGWYGLYIENTLKEHSPDLNYIMQQYDRY